MKEDAFICFAFSIQFFQRLNRIINGAMFLDMQVLNVKYIIIIITLIA